MHLALELGCTVSELEHRLTEREFLLWQLYSMTHILPNRRIELALAHITSWIAKTMGGVDANVPLSSFLLKPVVPDAEPSSPGAGAIFSGFNVAGMHILGQGRKLKKVS